MMMFQGGDTFQAAIASTVGTFINSCWLHQKMILFQRNSLFLSLCFKGIIVIFIIELGISLDFYIALVVMYNMWYGMAWYYIGSLVKIPLFALSLTMKKMFNLEIHFSWSLHGLYLATNLFYVALQSLNFSHICTMISFGGFLAECLPC